MEASYRGRQAYWRAYQRFFRDDLQCDEPTDEPDEEWWSWRGLSVHVDRLAAPQARLKLVLLHGAGGYGRLFLPYAHLARRLGFEVVAPDLPGYGLTRAHGSAVDYPMWLTCAVDLVEAERRQGDRPIVLFGASMGGMLAYSVAARTNVAAVVATCLLDVRLPEVRRRVARWPWLGPLALPMLRSLSLLGGIEVPVRWISNMHAMSNDPALTNLVERDPLGGGNRVSLRFLRSFLESTPPVEPESFDACPLLLVHPEADAWTPLATSAPFYARLACAKRLVLLDNCGHFPIEEPGITQLEQAMAWLVRELANAGC